MESTDPHALANSLWFLGWCAALGVLFVYGLRLPLHTRWARWGHWLYSGSIIVAALGVVVLANSALVLHDVHVDLTREGVFTPSAQAMAVIERLQQDVQVTYLYQADAPHGKRLRDVLTVMARRNPRLQVQTIDPDKQPSRARTAGVRLYNTAIIEAQGRRLVVQSTEENDIVLGVQRLLRERVITVCFMEGHHEYPNDNVEFHTHLEGMHSHDHGDAASKLVQMPGHGIGRLRRALEALGYESRTIFPAMQAVIPPDCTVVVNANPRTTYVPDESAALEQYLQRGGALLLLYDLGFVLEPRLAQLLAQLGVHLPQEVVLDSQQHYGTNPETVAVSGLEPHPITTNVSMTLFPGVRALRLVPPAPGLHTTPLARSSPASVTRAVTPVATREVEPSTPAPETATAPQAHILAVATEGVFPGAAAQSPSCRVVIVGDADFASNSFFPYLANSDLALAMLRWLVREERTPTVASRIPVPPRLVLTKAQMRHIFLLTEVLLPASVLLLGGVVWWRRR